VMEEQYSQTRVRTEQGQVKVSTNNLLVGIFRHETSREQDPQLHSHALVMNCTQLNNGQWRSLSNELIVHHSKFLGQIYQNELAHQLSECGYEIEQRDNGQFELKGYAELLETFSTRRQQIEEHLAPIEAPTLKQREHAALTTRQAKVQIAAEVLSQRWEEKLHSLDGSAPEIPEPADRPDLTKVVSQWAIAHCDERGNVFRSGAAEQYVVENFTGQVSLANLRNALREEAVVVDELTGLMMSERSLGQELDSIQMMESGKRPPLDDWSDLTEGQTTAEQASLTQLNDAIALNFALHDQVMSWQQSGKGGDADRLKRYKELVEQAGYSVKGYAPNVETAQWLAEDVGMESEPIAMLFNLQSEAQPQLQELDEEQESVQELEIWVIDKAVGMSPEAMNALLHKAQEQQAQLILIEKPEQSSVRIVGNAFQALQQAGMQGVEVLEVSLETLHSFSRASENTIKNDTDTESTVEIEQIENDKILSVEVETFSLETLHDFSPEWEDSFKNHSEIEFTVEIDCSLIPQVNSSALELEDVPAEVGLINLLEPETEEEKTTESDRIDLFQLGVEETTEADHISIQSEQVVDPLDQGLADSSSESQEALVLDEFPFSSEAEPPVRNEDEAKASQSHVQQNGNADFIAQLTRTTVQYFNTKLKQGEVKEVDSNIGIVESSDYWVVYHHNQENGQTPMLQVQEKATKSAIFEISRRDERWEAEPVKPEAVAWLEQASRELAARQERTPQIQKPQMEL
jgi:hypothetical protein